MGFKVKQFFRGQPGFWQYGLDVVPFHCHATGIPNRPESRVFLQVDRPPSIRRKQIAPGWRYRGLDDI